MIFNINIIYGNREAVYIICLYDNLYISDLNQTCIIMARKKEEKRPYRHLYSLEEVKMILGVKSTKTVMNRVLSGKGMESWDWVEKIKGKYVFCQNWVAAYQDECLSEKAYILVDYGYKECPALRKQYDEAVEKGQTGFNTVYRNISIGVDFIIHQDGTKDVKVSVVNAGYDVLPKSQDAIRESLIEHLKETELVFKDLIEKDELLKDKPSIELIKRTARAFDETIPRLFWSAYANDPCGVVMYKGDPYRIKDFESLKRLFNKVKADLEHEKLLRIIYGR